MNYTITEGCGVFHVTPEHVAEEQETDAIEDAQALETLRRLHEQQEAWEHELLRRSQPDADARPGKWEWDHCDTQIDGVDLSIPSLLVSRGEYSVDDELKYGCQWNGNIHISPMLHDAALGAFVGLVVGLVLTVLQVI